MEQKGSLSYQKSIRNYELPALIVWPANGQQLKVNERLKYTHSSAVWKLRAYLSKSFMDYGKIVLCMPVIWRYSARTCPKSNILDMSIKSKHGSHPSDSVFKLEVKCLDPRLALLTFRTFVEIIDQITTYLLYEESCSDMTKPFLFWQDIVKSELIGTSVLRSRLGFPIVITLFS